MKVIFAIACFILFSTLQSCREDTPSLYTLTTPLETGIDFENIVENTKESNIFNYRNFYNGGGVAAGDINNDGLIDLYFTSNTDSNKLYLNQGNLSFKDISHKSNTSLPKQWSTGVVMVDINADGWLDIYVCNAGYQKELKPKNSLFINNRDETFREVTGAFGLDDEGYTTHTAFFDYDLDGDLDAYILNNSFIPVNTLNNANNRDLRAKDWPVKDFLKGGGDRLMRNDGSYDQEGHYHPKYTDVSEESGIYGSLIGFGLGVTVGDVNNDYYPDIYVSNDFYEKDYLYINQGNGTFQEEIEKRIGHSSFASMGADMADINNDGHPEIFVTDMLPATEERLKTTTAFDSHYTYKLRLDRGFYHQYMQNTLQLNDGNGKFQEIANYSGVEASDWSWGALLFDADNDRNTDIFISNGIQHDVINQDFIDFFADELSKNTQNRTSKKSYATILSEIPSKPQINTFFKNEDGYKFSRSSEKWGIRQPTFSNGATYADLDNDGDLDLVINNVGTNAHLYKNNAHNTHFLNIKLKGDSLNSYAIGSKVTLHKGEEKLMREVMPSRGFQSSTSYILNFGLGDWTQLDSMVIIWPNKKKSYHQVHELDTLLTIKQNKSKASRTSILSQQSEPLFEKKKINLPAHLENSYEDYYNEKNIPFKLSEEGPVAIVGDLNGDGLEDIVQGGGYNQAATIYLQGNANPKSEEIFERHKIYEDTALLLFDPDGDHDLDLLIGSGGNQNKAHSPALQDRLYINDGKGNFSFSKTSLPPFGMNTSCLVSVDVDQDGDEDVFVGSRSWPQVYGKTPPSYLLQNDGNGKFNILQELPLGMITDVVKLGTNTLIAVGDWMPPTTLQIHNKKLKITENKLENYHGFWQSIQAFDYNNDGKQDLLLGNLGLNFALKTSKDEPLKLYLNDFDQNGTLDKVMSKTYRGKDVPVFLKRELTDQFPSLKSKSLKHATYAQKSLNDLFDPKLLRQSETPNVNYLAHAVAINEGEGTYHIQELPTEFQFSSIHAFLPIKTRRGNAILAVGNNTNMIPQFNTLDASRGWVYQHKKNRFLPHTGFEADGQAKQIIPITWMGKKHLLITVNGQKPQLFLIND